MDDLTFEQIFNEDGLYVGDDFVEGFCFKIMSGRLYGVQYKYFGDKFPEMDSWGVYKGLFERKYRKLTTIKSLFKSKSKSKK